MKILIYSLIFLLICLGGLFCACDFAKTDHLSTSKIECGVAKISGTFKKFNRLLRQSEEVLNIGFAVSKPLTGGSEIIEVEIKGDGSFSCEIPIEASTTFYLSVY